MGHFKSTSIPFKLDGDAIADAQGDTYLMGGFTEELEGNDGALEVLTGASILRYRNVTTNGRIGPTGYQIHRFPTNGIADEAVYERLKGLRSLGIVHTLACYGLVEFESFDGNGARTEFYPFAEILGTAYGASSAYELAAGGLNAAAAPNYVEYMRLWNRLSGAYESVIFGRRLTVVAFAGLVGQTVTVTITGPSGTPVATVLTGVAGAPAAGEFQCAGSNAATATSLAAALNAISGIASTASGDDANYWKDLQDSNVVDVSHTGGANLTARPTTAEYALEIQGAHALRNLKAGTAPGTGRSTLLLKAWRMYRVRIESLQFAFPPETVADGYVPYTMVFKEVGR